MATKKKTAPKKQTTPLRFPRTSDKMTTGKQTPLVIGGLIIDEKAALELIDRSSRCNILEVRRDFWKAKALGFHLALQQQQKGMARMKKKLDRLKGTIAKREKYAQVITDSSKEMAKRLDGIRMFTDSSVKVEKTEKREEPVGALHISELAKFPVEEAFRRALNMAKKKDKG